MQLKNKIKTALHDSPFVRVICWTIKWIRKYQESAFMFIFMFIVWFALILMLVAFISLMFNCTIFNWHIPTLLYDWLGTKEDKAKHETLKFIGFGIGGVLATIGAIAFNRRATAQIEASKAQTQHNKLIEKGHVNERLKSTIDNLGHIDASVRIASFYQFYHLAKEGEKDFRHNIFEILCSCLRCMDTKRSHLTEEDGKERPTAECQTLLNILFRNKHDSALGGFEPDLRRSYLIRANLGHAHLSDANFTRAHLVASDLRHANLMGADFTNADLSGADLSCANLVGADLSGADLSHANFTSANLSDTSILRAKFLRTIFENTNLSRANLVNAKLSNADLLASNFSGANLTYVNLSDKDLIGVNLSGTNLLGAELKDTEFKHVISIQGANFCGATVDGKPISRTLLPNDKGEYYADWNPPPKKAES